ncbi:hypothetical protein GCM10009530_72430 [Microbispora corallina]|uniref:Uncharacterized protein n=1 Tax=Microbispora corallina TaxID=83302 RepID=A0ABQ4G4E2_9ACTN|nr:hypothetical protein [Microbispora corallina]GIH41909.1 hypothetical protein Mco01_49090 [Microbispora corallina]
MALIALAADKGAPGVTTAAVALGAVWPRAVMVAECDTAGGDLAYRLPGEGGSPLNPARGLLSLGATARRGLRPEQIREHTQELVGGLEVLVGINGAEQAAGLTWLWEPLGQALKGMPADVLADCGRIGSNPEIVDLLAQADAVVLFARPTLEQVAHLRERVVTLGRALGERSRRPPEIGIVVIAEQREYGRSLAEVRRVMQGAGLPDVVLGGLAYDVKGADLLRGEWGGRLDRTLLIRSAREVAATLLSRVPRPAPAPEAVR